MYGSFETEYHTMIPLGYNRVLRSRHKGSPVHGAAMESELQTIASMYPSEHMKVPAVYGLKDMNSYEMDSFFYGEDTFQCVDPKDVPTSLLIDIFSFNKYMRQNGYFPKGFTVVLGESVWVFDFSQFGLIHSDIVRYPDGLLLTVDESMARFDLYFRIIRPRIS